MGKAYLDSVRATNERFGYQWEKIDESYEICPICSSKMWVTSNHMMFVLDGNTVFHCEKEDDHTFWRNARGDRDEMMYHPNSSETNFDYLAIYRKDENGKWYLYE